MKTGGTSGTSFGNMSTSIVFNDLGGVENILSPIFQPFGVGYELRFIDDNEKAKIAVLA